jgi:phosphatidylglycerophosphatase A
MILKVSQKHLLETSILAMNKFNNFHIFYSTGFFTGFVPFAPGTIGTITGIIIFLLTSKLSPLQQSMLFLLYFSLSIIATKKAILFLKSTDPPQIVCDEIIGIWISLMFFKPNVKTIILGFILFRLLDILKPFPIKHFEKLPGAFGIIADDLIAGLFTKGLLWLILTHL